MVGRGPGSRRRAKTGKAYPVIGEPTPSRDLLRPALIPHTQKGGLLGRVLWRPPLAPPGHPDPLQIQTQKKQHKPIQGDRKKKYSRRPNCRHTPTSAPHTPGRPARHSLRAIARCTSNKGPGGAEPKVPTLDHRNSRPPQFARHDATRNNIGRHRAKICVRRSWAKNTTVGGHHVHAAKRQHSQPPAGFTPLRGTSFPFLAAAPIPPRSSEDWAGA